jgi:inhibitor of KinA sporulation pathway (predicted exonuclease)
MRNLIFLDLELNNPFTPEQRIIQIGYAIVSLDKGVFTRVLERTLFVNPNQPIQPEITELTGITDDVVHRYGITLPEAYSVLVDDVKRLQVNRTCAQWGEGDARCLREELGLAEKDFIFRRRTFDIKTFFQLHTLVCRPGKLSKGLAGAISYLGMEFEGTPHRATDDAINTFRVFERLSQDVLLGYKVKELMK